MNVPETLTALFQNSVAALSSITNLILCTGIALPAGALHLAPTIATAAQLGIQPRPRHTPAGHLQAHPPRDQDPIHMIRGLARQARHHTPHRTTLAQRGPQTSRNPPLYPTCHQSILLGTFMHNHGLS